jgi:hypothetical protein
MPQKTQQPATELGAFCATCPDAEDVSALLTRLGFRLEFQMDEQPDRSSQLPPLPAQYHYKDASGTEVIFLAGQDSPLDGEPLPAHASRFWLYRGADADGFELATSIVAREWRLAWRDLSAPAHQQQEEVA